MVGRGLAALVQSTGAWLTQIWPWQIHFGSHGGALSAWIHTRRRETGPAGLTSATADTHAHTATSIAMSTTRGVAITAIGNSLPPAAMLVTQVLLAQSLGVSGRGAVAAATAPLMFAVALLALGLPESLTYFVARGGAGRISRQLGISLVALAISGSIGTWLIVVFAQPLSAGSTDLAALMTLASAALVPALLTGALRGVAYAPEVGGSSWRSARLARYSNSARWADFSPSVP